MQFRCGYFVLLSASLLLPCSSLARKDTEKQLIKRISSVVRNKRTVVKSSNDVILNPSITSLIIESNITARFSTVSVRSTVTNENSESTEAQFVLQLPSSAFISNFEMIINNTLIKSEIYPKEEAQKKYDDAKTRGESTGQVSAKPPPPGRDMQVFAINVNVASNSSVVFSLTYKELLDRRRGLYTQRISLKPQQIVEHLRMDIYVWEPQGFELFQYRLPGSHTAHTSSSANTALKAMPNKRSVIYSPELDILDQKATGFLSGEFIIQYDVKHTNDGGLIIVDEEHFVHYFSPSGLLPLMKHIVFVIDISGSMSGQKITQTRDAMITILNQLRRSDYFSILVFDGQVRAWRERPVAANEININSAKAFANSALVARGSTNINSALLEGLDVLIKSFERGASAARLLVFLTDGVPSAGIQSTTQIRQNVRNRNELNFSIFSLGFGMNVNFEFLDALSWENGGFARKIYVDSDAGNQLEEFYDEISTPLLLDVKIDYPDGYDSGSLTQNSFPQYFEGSELVVAGGLQNNVRSDFTARIAATGDESAVVLEASSDVYQMDSIIDHEFTKQLWAYKKIKGLLMEMNAAKTVDMDKYEKLKGKALNMSLTYRFVTPLTSLLAIQESTPPQKGLESGSRYSGGLNIKQSVDVFASDVGVGGGGVSRLSSTDMLLWLVLVLNFLYFKYRF